MSSRGAPLFEMFLCYDSVRRYLGSQAWGGESNVHFNLICVFMVFSFGFSFNFRLSRTLSFYLDLCFHFMLILLVFLLFATQESVT